MNLMRTKVSKVLLLGIAFGILYVGLLRYNLPRVEVAVQNPSELDIKIKYQTKLKEIAAPRERTFKYAQTIPEGVVKDPPSKLSQRDEVPENAVQSFEKNSRSIGRAWGDYRIGLYRNIGVQGEDLKTLDDLLKDHLAVIGEIQKEASSSKLEMDSPEYKVFTDLNNEAYRHMDEEVQKFLGTENFQYIKDARAKFNKAFQEHTKSHIEFIAW